MDHHKGHNGQIGQTTVTETRTGRPSKIYKRTRQKGDWQAGCQETYSNIKGAAEISEVTDYSLHVTTVSHILHA